MPMRIFLADYNFLRFWQQVRRHAGTVCRVDA